MGKKLKKGTKGNAAQYLSRNMALKRLQVPLSVFRRLCILKGIHPREPKKKTQGANKTYYHVKDINWLLHEPLLDSFRSQRAYDKKVKKAEAKQNAKLAKRLAAARPTYRLDHLVRERYPSFIDALRDLDDPLTLIHLFATLPAEGKFGIPVATVGLARRLALEWQAFVARSHSLRKVFVSVKGFYFQAEVMGQAVTWLVPHTLAQVLTPDVDYKVLLTFLEFYATLAQFVHFKLFATLGLPYPPLTDRKLEAAAAGLAAIMRDLAGVKDAVDRQNAAAEAAASATDPQRSAEMQARLASLPGKLATFEGAAADGQGTSDDASDEDAPALEINSDGSDDSEESDGSDDDANGASGATPMDLLEAAAARSGGLASTSAPADASADAAALAGGALGVDADDDAAVCAALFKGAVFFLAREVPREPLMFVIRSFGGVAAWEGEGSPYGENAEEITHQVVDRPTQGHRFLARQYVQPQWVFDSANARVLMPVDLYEPGKVPPPHLSPFINNEEEGYTPDFAATVARLQDAARAARLRAAGALLPEGGFLGDTEAEAGEAAAAAAEEDLEAVEKAYHAELAKELAAAQRGESESEPESDGEESSEEEAAEKPASKAAAAKAAEAAEAAAMADIMMPRKTRKLYERINRAVEGKKERVEALERKKRALEQEPPPQQAKGAKGDAKSAAAAGDKKKKQKK